MPFDPFSLSFAAPWVYDQLKKEHKCIKCKEWKLRCNKVSKCCTGAICTDCESGWLIRKNGKPTCPNPDCGHEFE